MTRNLTILSPEEAYYKSQFRESLDKNGKLNFADEDQNLYNIRNLDLVNIETNTLIKVNELI